jgi:hypothetical protein
MTRNGFGANMLAMVQDPLLGLTKVAAIFFLVVGWLVKAAGFKLTGYVAALAAGSFLGDFLNLPRVQISPHVGILKR